MKSERQELLWVATGQALSLGVGFLSVKILTTMMGAELYGQLMLGISVAALVSLFIYGPLGQAAGRFYSVCRKRGDLGHYASAFRHIYTHLLWVLLLPTFAAAFVFDRLIGGVWSYLVAAAVIYSAVAGINHGLLSMFSAMRRRAAVALHLGSESAARLLGALLAMLMVGISPVVALFGYAGGSLLVLGSLLRLASKEGELNHKPRPRTAFAGVHFDRAGVTMYKEIWQYVMPFLSWAAIGYAFMHGDRWMLQSVRGPEAVGTYMAIYQIGSALPNAIVSVISQHLEPLVFDKVETASQAGQVRHARALLRRAVLSTGLLLLVMVMLASAWSKEIVELVTNREFAQHSGLLAWIVAAAGIIGLTQILTIHGLALRRPSAYLWPKAAAAAALFAAAYFGATQRGSEGVAMALTFAAVVYLLCVVYVNVRLQRHEVP